MSVNLLITAGTVADCAQAAALLDGIPLGAASAEYLLADRGYDTDKHWRRRGDALCEDCGGVPGDLPDTALAIWARLI